MLLFQVAMIEAYLRANNMFVDYSEVNKRYPLHAWSFTGFQLLSGSYMTSFTLCKNSASARAGLLVISRTEPGQC